MRKAKHNGKKRQPGLSPYWLAHQVTMVGFLPEWLTCETSTFLPPDFPKIRALGLRNQPAPQLSPWSKTCHLLRINATILSILTSLSARFRRGGGVGLPTPPQESDALDWWRVTRCAAQTPSPQALGRPGGQYHGKASSPTLSLCAQC